MFTKTPFIPGTEGIWLGLPSEIYHSAPGISQSMLKAFDEEASPLHYSTREWKKPTEDMEFGTICHTAVLEPEKLKDAYHIQPKTYLSKEKTKKGEPEAFVEKPWHNGADVCKKWTAEHSDRPIIDREKEDHIPKIVNRLSQLQEFGDALRKGKREVSFFKRDSETGVLLKCRVDVLAVDASNGDLWIFDMKKVQRGGAKREFFEKSVYDFGYHIQCASYKFITGARHFTFVPFDDCDPFDAAQFELLPKDEAAGFREWRRILDAFNVCSKENKWPGYPAGIQQCGLPAYARKKLTP